MRILKATLAAAGSAGATGLVLTVVAGSLILGGCFEGSTGGSETTNGLSGVIRDGSGNPAAGSEVTLVPADYNPVPGRDARPLRRTLAGGDGRYRFAAVSTGTYSLEARDSVRDLKLLRRDIRVEGTADTADGVLAPTAMVRIPFAERALPSGVFAYLAGTTWFALAQVGEGDKVDLVRLPAGLLPEIALAFPDASDDPGYALADSVALAPAEVRTFGPYEAWTQAGVLRSDFTAVSGRDSLAGLPVLLRLNSGNFDFSQALPDGRDLRVLRGDSLLAHQVEHWDSAGKSAAVWVRMDSLPGNAGDTSLVLRWGRGDARDVSSGPAVFAAGRGFAAAWHLSEPDGTAPGAFRDATASGVHATASTAAHGKRVTAPAGFGRRFGEADSSLQAPLPAGFATGGSFTVTFRMECGAARWRQSILRFGADATALGFHFLIRGDTTAQFGPFDISADTQPSAQQNHFSLKPHLGKWIHVATVYDAGSGTLTTYVDGEAAATNGAPSLAVRPDSGVRFGSRLWSESGFNGSLDEVRFYHRPMGVDWVRAEHAAAKEGSGLLELKP